MKRRLILTTLCILAVGLVCLEANAEVRVQKDRKGAYKTARVVVGALERPAVWSPDAKERSSDRVTALNPVGDAMGDLWPTLVESTVIPNHPWAVWSRYRHSGDYDLVWSRWNGHHWDPIRPLTEHRRTDGDDLDADVMFASNGLPYVAWWRDEGGQGRVYLSLFLNSRWMTPFPVSHEGLDGRYPSIVRAAPEGVRLQYEVTHGNRTTIVEEFIAFDRPATITDDIDPLDHLVTKESMVIGRK